MIVNGAAKAVGLVLVLVSLPAYFHGPLKKFLVAFCGWPIYTIIVAPTSPAQGNESSNVTLTFWSLAVNVQAKVVSVSGSVSTVGPSSITVPSP